MKFTAHIWDHSLHSINRNNLTIEALAPHLVLTLADDQPPYPGKIKVGEVDLEIELIPPEQIVAGAAAALQLQAQQIRAEASQKAMKLEAKAEQLLAIENKPTNLEKN